VELGAPTGPYSIPTRHMSKCIATVEWYIYKHINMSEDLRYPRKACLVPEGVPVLQIENRRSKGCGTLLLELVTL
jgi:hypothetical protein